MAATGVTFFWLNTLIVFVLLACKDEVNCATRKEAPETLSADEPSAQGQNHNLCRNFEEIKTMLLMNILSAPNEASASGLTENNPKEVCHTNVLYEE